MRYAKTKTILTRIISLVLIPALLISIVTSPIRAKTLDELKQERDEFAAQIEAKKLEIATLESQLSNIAEEVASYQNAIARINYEIQLLDGRIAVTQAEYDDLQAQISELEIEIENNKNALGLTLRELYNTKNISTIERLATSNSLTSFIDKEAQLDNISSELTKTVDAIEADKEALEISRLAAEQKLTDLAAQKSEQDSKRQEQQNLLNLSRAEQAAYGDKKRIADTERAQLEAAQRKILVQIALATGAGDPTKGGYPYTSSCPSYNLYDPWGMMKCQCVSYTAWKVHELYLLKESSVDMPYWGGRGNAYNWYVNAGDDGIPRGKEPKVDSVGVMTDGEFGHVVWVEAILGGGVILVSEYNGQRDRNYSETKYYVSSFQGYNEGFIYFNER